jgi:membrane fusion protein, multidrug efflux system
VQRSNQGDTVLVVGADSKPQPRPVKIGSAQGGNWVVLEGLKAGEQVIVDGFQKMMVPGAPVKPVPWSPGASAAAGAPAAAGSAPAAAPAPASAASRT